jgi:hypothetical protein
MLFSYGTSGWGFTRNCEVSGTNGRTKVLHMTCLYAISQLLIGNATIPTCTHWPKGREIPC